tara:strand:+ start:181 stop:843 length:663 start_codon:yes stop_codon:yes gene_type:complete
MINVVYQPRGTIQTLFSALNALFAPWRDAVKLNVSIDAQGSFVHPDLTTAHAHRWVKIDSGGVTRYAWLETVNEGTNTGQINTLKCAYWDAWSAAVTGEMSFLPFLIVEDDARVRLVLDTFVLSVPPTYLQSTGSVRPQGQPNGGHLLNLLDLDPNTIDYGDQQRGPFPLYLHGDMASGILGDLLRRLIPAGIKTEIIGAQYGGDIGFPTLSDLITTGGI